MKDNNPQTVGELLSRMGNKGRAGAPVPPGGNNRLLARILPLALLIIIFAAATAYYFRGFFFNSGKQAPGARSNSSESQRPKTETTSPDSRAAINSPSPAAQLSPRAGTPPTPTSQPAVNTGAQPETAAKGERPTSLPEAPPPTPSGAATTRAEGNLTIQVGAYATAADANKLAERLKAAGVEAYVVRATLPNHGVVYRVQAGHFNDPGEAARYADQLRADGLAQDTFVKPGGRQ